MTNTYVVIFLSVSIFGRGYHSRYQNFEFTVFTMQSDFGFAKGDWVRVVLIAFWDSVTLHFSFQKDAKAEGQFLTKFVLKLFCCIVSKNYLQKISDIYWLVTDNLEGKDI